MIDSSGKYVIPRFKNPRAVVRPADAILADIRTAAHYAGAEAFGQSEVPIRIRTKKCSQGRRNAMSIGR